MTHHSSNHHPAGGPSTLEADVVRQREQLAHTVDDLRDRLDVKHRAQERVHEMKERATTPSGRPRTDLVAGGVAAATVAAAVLVWQSWWAHRKESK